MNSLRGHRPGRRHLPDRPRRRPVPTAAGWRWMPCGKRPGRAGPDCHRVEVFGPLGVFAGQERVMGKGSGLVRGRHRPPWEPLRPPEGESGAHRVDQCGDAPLIPRVERRNDDLRPVLRRHSRAGVHVVDRQVAGDVGGGPRGVDRLREVAHAADAVVPGGDHDGLAPVLLVHGEVPAEHRGEEGGGAGGIVGLEVHPAELVQGGGAGAGAGVVPRHRALLGCPVLDTGRPHARASE